MSNMVETLGRFRSLRLGNIYVLSMIITAYAKLMYEAP